MMYAQIYLMIYIQLGSCVSFISFPLILILVNHRNDLSATDQDDVKDLTTLLAGISVSHGSAYGVSCMHAPLHLALLISPIYLLLPVQLFKKSYNRHMMLSISQSLGNKKPKIILDVEMAIWRTLFSLASGLLDPQYFAVPHIFQWTPLDSCGFLGIPVDSSGLSPQESLEIHRNP